MVVILDLRGICHGKAHTGEHVDDLVGDQRQRVQTAHGAGLGRQGDIHRLGGVAGSKFCLLHGLGGGIVVCLHLLLEFVDDLAHGGALFRRNGAQILHQGRDLAVFAEVFLPEGSQRLLAGHLTKAFSGLLGQLIDHCLHGFSLLYSLCSWSGVQQKKAPSPARLLRQKGRSFDHFCSAVPPGFRLHQGRRHSNAVTGRNRPVLIDASASFAQTARERTSAPAAHGSPFSR